ncbi:MCM5, partial [Cervus elaphus hippelaphus]
QFRAKLSGKQNGARKEGIPASCALQPIPFSSFFGGGTRRRRAVQSLASGSRRTNEGAAAAASKRCIWFFPRNAAVDGGGSCACGSVERGKAEVRLEGLGSAVMSGFDDPGVFYSDSFGGDNAADEGQARKSQLQRRFKEFLRQYRVGTDRTGFTFKYRDELKRHYNLGEYWIEVEMEDLASFDEELADYLYKQPAEHLQLLEEAAKEVADEVTRPRPAGDEVLQDIQVMLKSEASPSSIRSLKSDTMSHLVKIPGIVIAASGVRAKATRISIQCRSCRSTLTNIAMRPGLEGYALPRKCNTDQAGRPKCPLDPYFIMPDKCKCVDFQTLKLQELPDAVPHGEMPRHMQLYCDRYLCDKVVPGNRVTIMGIYSIKKFGLTSNRGRDRVGVGIRSAYIRVLGIQALGWEGGPSHTCTPSARPGRTFAGAVTPQEEEEFRRLAALPIVYELISKSIAPSIFGGTDMKKAIACLLFGGSRKSSGGPWTYWGQSLGAVLGPDPPVAFPQVYTSGKGSSAAGLTASVMRDPSSRNFIMEGGAMVLADGGVVCIDEFDKMREDDRVAIHEAMEQQTISIAKAGITTTLNSRCSVLAAANSVFGRWDETKGEDNIDFMPTILSRFDMIFIVKDEHNEERDVMLAKHVITLHVSALTQAQAVEGEIDLAKLKKFIAYCRTLACFQPLDSSHQDPLVGVIVHLIPECVGGKHCCEPAIWKCGPRLSAEAAEKLKNRYIIMRSGARQHERDSDRRSSIPITVRQLEAIVRIAEALSKMKLQPFATEADVEEALRLFQVSTLDAALSGTLSGVEGFTSQEDQELLSRIEKQLKRRFAIGSQVSEHSIIQDFTKQVGLPGPGPTRPALSCTQQAGLG